MSVAPYVIPVWDTITTAWEKVHGSKKTFIGAFLLFLLIMFVLGFVSGVFLQISQGLGQVVKIIANILGYFLQMGLVYMGIRRAADQPIEYKQLFRVFNTTIALNIVILYLLQIVVFLPIIFFLVIVSYFLADSSLIIAMFYTVGAAAVIYLAIRLMLSNCLVLDKGTEPWEAIKLSFKATRGNFWHCLAIIILQIIILLVSMIPFGIGLIWTLPFSLICYGTIYRRLQANLI